MQLAFIADEAFSLGLGVALHSALKRTAATDAASAAVHVWILDLGLSPESRLRVGQVASQHRAEVWWLAYDDTILPGVPDNVKGTWAKLVLAHVLPATLDTVLHLDCDTVTTTGLGPLWAEHGSIMGSDTLVAAVRDFGLPCGHTELSHHGWQATEPYFNAGVLVMNLRALRRAFSTLGPLLGTMTWGDALKMRHCEQDVLNLACRGGRWMPLEYKWNVQGIGSYLRDRTQPHPLRPQLISEEQLHTLEAAPAIIHFTGTDDPTPSQLLSKWVKVPTKPWAYVCDHPYKALFYELVDETPWAGWRPHQNTLAAATGRELLTLTQLLSSTHPGFDPEAFITTAIDHLTKLRRQPPVEAPAAAQPPVQPAPVQPAPPAPAGAGPLQASPLAAPAPAAAEQPPKQAGPAAADRSPAPPPASGGKAQQSAQPDEVVMPSPAAAQPAAAEVAAAQPAAAQLPTGQQAAAAPVTTAEPAAAQVTAAANPASAVLSQVPGLQFSNDWFDPHCRHWEQHVVPLLANRPDLRILEIGCWEGRSTCWLLLRLATHPGARVVCVDPYELGHEPFLANRRAFERNVQATGAGHKVQLIQDYCRRALPRLLVQAQQPTPAAAGSGSTPGVEGVFDLVYVDGSHLRLDVLTDAVMAWQLLREAGIMVFDDYEWDRYRDNMACHPKEAVDAFCQVVAHCSRVMHRGYQVIMQKTPV